MGKVVTIGTKKRSTRSAASPLPAYLTNVVRDLRPKITRLAMDWIFVLYRTPRNEDGKIIVDFTLVKAPGEPEEDRRHLVPFLEDGWQPLVVRSSEDGTPLANLPFPGKPENTFREAIAILPSEKREAILAPDVTLNYVPTCTPKKRRKA